MVQETNGTVVQPASEQPIQTGHDKAALPVVRIAPVHTTPQAPTQHIGSGKAGIWFNRPPRTRPVWSDVTVDLPEQPVPFRRNPQSILLQVAMPLLAVVVMGLAYSMISANSNAWLFILPMGAIGVVGAIGTLLMQRSQERQQREEFHARVAFFEEQLAEAQKRLAHLAYHEREARCYIAPEPEGLLRIAGVMHPEQHPEPRLWERRPWDDDFLELRLGIGSVVPGFAVRAPTPPRDAAPDRRIYALQQQYATLTGVPISVPLARIGSLGLAGPKDRRDALLRAMLWQVVALHAPSEVRLAFVCPPEHTEEWEWLRWLDHTIPPSNEPGQRLRMVVSEPRATAAMLSALLDEFSRRRDRIAQARARSETPPIFPTILLVVIGARQLQSQPLLVEMMRAGATHQMLLICVEDRWEELPGDCAAMVDLNAEGEVRIARAGASWSTERCIADAAALESSDKLARCLAGIRLMQDGARQELPRNKRLFDMLDITSEADLHPPRFWHALPEEAWHRNVPIGVRADGEAMVLNLNQNAHGPHGIIAGTTGAGKSVLLQAIIAALTITHPPERLNLLLIDFKGGASLAMFEALAHTIGMVTDLEGRLAERAMTAIKSEIRRRKRILRETAASVGGKVEDIHDYRAVANKRQLPPLPNLLIVIDEFDEMVKTYPDFVTELVRVVKQGRSLGVHLLVASQQPARAVTDEIRTQLKFFIALRLGSADDSREMILKTDAAFLPTNIPGRAYMRVGSEAELFQVAHVAGTYHEAHSVEQQAVPRISLMIDGQERVIDGRRATVTHEDRQRITDLDVLVRVLGRASQERLAQLAARGWHLQPIWQQPLPSHLTLGELRQVTPDPVELQAALRAVWGRGASYERWLQATLGLIDIPQESRQEVLRVNLAEQHLAVIGAPGSGKTTLLRTLILSLTLNHSPQDLWFYGLDGGGQGLSILNSLPHLGDVVQVSDRERVQRLFYMLNSLVRERQERLRAAGASDLPAYRRTTGERIPAIILIIHRIAILREAFGDSFKDVTILDDLVRLLRVCKPCGIHIVITADSPRDMPYKLLSLLDRRIAMRLPDIHDYIDVLGGRVSGQIPTSLPGRALCTLPELGILDTQIALPLLDTAVVTDKADAEQATITESELNAELKQLVTELAQAWNGPAAVSPPQVRLLPERVSLEQVLHPESASDSGRTELRAVLGLESNNLTPTALRLDQDAPHALIVGPRRSGKTTALRTLVLSLARSYRPEQLRIILIDPHRGGLSQLRKLRHVEHYARSETEIKSLTSFLDQLRQTRSAKQRRVVVIDDFHIGKSSMKQEFTQAFTGDRNLFQVLNDLAISGAETGVHLLIAAQITYADDSLLKRLDESRTGIILWPHTYDPGTKLLGISLPSGERGAELPPGRAFLIQEDSQQLVQLAYSEAEYAAE